MKNLTAVVPFQFQNNQIRTISINQETWFVSADICTVLGIVNNRDALTRIPDHHKGVASIDTLGGKQRVSIISESGMYRLVLRSDKPQAEPFIEWVTAEVLPQIRKTGKYHVGQNTCKQQNRSIPTVEANGKQYLTMQAIANHLNRHRSFIHRIVVRHHAELRPVKIRVDVPHVGKRAMTCVGLDKLEIVSALVENGRKLQPATYRTPMLDDGDDLYAEAESAKGKEHWHYDPHNVTKVYMKDIYDRNDELNAEMLRKGIDYKPSPEGIELSYFLELGMYMCHEFPKMARKVMEMTIRDKEGRVNAA